jgi:hypothetical protein
MLQRCERFRRRLPAIEHPLINQVGEQADATELGGKLPAALANRLRINRGEASRRIHEAADLGERKAITGEPLPPVLPATAEARRARTHRSRPRDGDPRFLASTARLHRRRDPREGRDAAGPVGQRASPRRVEQAGRQTHRLPQPRRELHRRRPGSAARRHHRQTRHRRHVPDQRAFDPGGPRHPRRRPRKTGRAGHVQPRRPQPVHQRHPMAGRHRQRHPQLRSTQPRRTHRGGTRPAGLR